ncbi:type II toxin-antitoxin system VapB family antitoxin [Bosea sp. R86505]|uniref:type II toxin-antitoxin system VapB family antitoxin n=1 Tax=Bosea sp. R86505 TaxID=3101710 RepID=UPI00366F9CD6
MPAKTRATTKLFVTNRSQAVRLPKELAFPPEVTEVEIIRQGSGVLIVPKGKGWSDFFERGPHVDEDFMKDWTELPADEREPL